MSEHRENPTDTYEQSRSVASMAIQEVKSFDQLNHDVNNEEKALTRKKLVLGEVDSKYTEALMNFAERSAELAPTSFLEKLMGKIVDKMGLEEKIVKEGIKVALRGGSKETTENILKVFNDMPKHIPELIDNLLQSEEVDQQIRENLKAVSEGLKAGDQMLNAKIVVEMAMAVLDKYGIDDRYQLEFIRYLMSTNTSEIGDINPASANIDVFKKLQNYGLMQYLPSHMFFSLGAVPGDFGKNYTREVVSEWNGKPKIDEVSAIPYEERERAWREETNSYRLARDSAVAQLSAFDQHRKEQGLSTVYDNNWLRENFWKIREQIEGLLNNPASTKLYEYSKKPKNMRTWSGSIGRRNPQFQEVSNAIKIAFEFGSRYDTPDSENLLQSAMFAYRDMMMGLYDIKEAGY